MANKKDHIKVKLGSFVYLHKFSAGVSVLTFFVILIAGARVDAPLSYKIDLIVFRAFVALLVIQLLTRILVRILKTYEEMNSGEAQANSR
ncbi:MAG: hypothetical protein GX589_03695 [Deltaproteobacteria bacterium]|nr:hypothetical protein [Deltaproteobacteria bacterium]